MNGLNLLVEQKKCMSVKKFKYKIAVSAKVKIFKICQKFQFNEYFLEFINKQINKIMHTVLQVYPKDSQVC